MNSNLYQIRLPWVGTNEFEHESWNDCEMFENIEHFNFDKKLTRYSKRFNSIELDISFQAGSKKSKYTTENIKAWIQLVNKPFIFNVKLSGHITHITFFDKETLELLWENWWNITKHLGDYLGCIIVEFNDLCPWDNEWLDKLEHFVDLLEKSKERDNFKEIKIVCEFKHSSFYNEIMYHFMRKHNWCVARIHSVNKLPDTKNIELGCIMTYDYIYDEWIDPIIEGWSPDVRTANFTYYKLYGVDGFRSGVYSPIDDVWNVCLHHLEKMVNSQEETFLFMNNTYFPLTIDYELKEGYPTITNPPAVADCDSVYNKYPRIINHKVDDNIVIKRKTYIAKYKIDIEEFKKLGEIEKIKKIKELEYKKINNIVDCRYEEKIEISDKKFQSEIINEMKQKEYNEKNNKNNENNKNNDKNNDNQNNDKDTLDDSSDIIELNDINTDDNKLYFDNKNNNYLCNNFKLKNEFKIDDLLFINVDHYLYYCEYNYTTNDEIINKKLKEYSNFILNCDTFSKAECLYKKKYTSNSNSLINKKKKHLGTINKIIKNYQDVEKDNNWNNIKKDLIKKALLEKFKNVKLKKLLLETEDKHLIYKKDKNNLLGILLMEVRKKLKN